MNYFIKISLGLVLGIITFYSNAQTTRTLFTGGATIDRDYNISYSFNDPSCRSVTSRLSYLAGPLDWFDSKVYCAGFSEPVLTFTYGQYGYPSPSPIKSCRITRSNNPNLLFYYAQNCSAYVGAKVISSPQPVTRDLYSWSSSAASLTYTMYDSSCYSQFSSQGEGYTKVDFSSVYCAGISDSVATLILHSSSGGWKLYTKHNKALVTESPNAGFVKFQTN